MISTWSRGAADENMPEQFLVATLDRVRRHPWWQARAKLVLAALLKNNIFPPATLAEVGCGWGTNLDVLENEKYAITGFDISRRILEVIDRPGRNLVEMDLNQELPPDHPHFDALLALDVIEHLDDDRGAVCRMAELLCPNGLAIVSVPALPGLFSEFDEIQGHRRRYLPETLKAAFAGSGLTVQQIFFWGAWMVPVLRQTRRRAGGKKSLHAKTYLDYLRLPPWPLPALMRFAYDREKKAALEGSLQSGTSLFAIAIRK
jgi:2-polyprenyl-3-methyl-5-hydroxy-6-metoxy-1,4-benzoquinol methylase